VDLYEIVSHDCRPARGGMWYRDPDFGDTCRTCGQNRLCIQRGHAPGFGPAGIEWCIRCHLVAALTEAPAPLP
jgi:hypothetical protein